jgi:hypothetical protein
MLRLDLRLSQEDARNVLSGLGIADLEGDVARAPIS